MTSAFSLRIFVADIDPDGLRIVERSKRIGKACKLMLVVGSLFLGAQVHAAKETQPCSTAQLHQLGTHLGVAKFDMTEDGVVVSAACKPWPKDPGSTLIAVAYDAHVEDEKQLVVAVTETVSGKVLSLFKEAYIEDAAIEFGGGSLWLDTARYDLRPGVRAFGVGIDSVARGSRCPQNGIGPLRTLYVQECAKVRPVLKELSMERWTFVSGGHPMCLGDKASEVETVVESFPVRIGVAKTVTKGFSDLIVTASSELDSGEESGRPPFRFVLKYDGSQYPTEALEHAYWKWRSWQKQ